jgi:ABC-type Fe3+/spermidine/putrescine transport system ATPase subunit
MTALLTLEQLRKSFGKQLVLREISLAVEEGEIMTLLGPSGSGKTTLLRLIAGFETPDSGSIEVGSEDVTRVPPERRNFGMVFQHYALFPHMTVAQNVAFGLDSQKLSRETTRKRVAEMLELVDLAGFQDRKVQEISGGQQQRVALARALAPHPRILLLDEPLSNLDPDLRERTRRQLRRAIQQVGLTAVWVTHEQEEAFDVGDRVALLEGGALEQVGTPEDLYLRPSSRFVATFVGRASILAGEQRAEGRAQIGDTRFRGQGVIWPVETAEGIEAGEEVDIVFRPEALTIGPPDQDATLAGEIVERRFTGESTFFLVRLTQGESLLVKGAVNQPITSGLVSVALREDAVLPRSYRRSAPSEDR